ncbi:toxin-antitoxin system subunit antitoxin [Vibrio cholerae]|nr:toxin-antitoxin system subunit antitoxin [Vibrio cholerae]MVB52318.1 toxin-antitoxin system subunit antitoxin [Vibrio cholerae]MVC35913.1 toxin-antitoxin system subunit antitoxin [Vibrio cholerae]
MEGIARGERALADGKVVSHQDAKDRMSKWLK